jgi:hypothetical protein
MVECSNNINLTANERFKIGTIALSFRTNLYGLGNNVIHQLVNYNVISLSHTHHHHHHHHHVRTERGIASNKVIRRGMQRSHQHSQQRHIHRRTGTQSVKGTDMQRDKNTRARTDPERQAQRQTGTHKHKGRRTVISNTETSMESKGERHRLT